MSVSQEAANTIVRGSPRCGPYTPEGDSGGPIFFLCLRRTGVAVRPPVTTTFQSARFAAASAVHCVRYPAMIRVRAPRRDRVAASIDLIDTASRPARLGAHWRWSRAAKPSSFRTGTPCEQPPGGNHMVPSELHHLRVHGVLGVTIAAEGIRRSPQHASLHFRPLSSRWEHAAYVILRRRRVRHLARPLAAGPIWLSLRRRWCPRRNTPTHDTPSRPLRSVRVRVLEPAKYDQAAH